MNRFLPAVRVTGLCVAAAVTMFVLAWLRPQLAWQDGAATTLWFANGVFIAWLLRRPQTDWPFLLTAAFTGNVTAHLVTGDPAALAVALAACNTAEILLVASLFARRFSPAHSFHSLEHLGRLGLLALAGPACSMVLAGACLALLRPEMLAEPLIHGALANTLGILVLTPLVLALTGPRSSEGGATRPEFALLFLTASLLTATVFTHETSAIFLLTPLLVFAGFRVRVGQAVVLVALVCGIALVLTLHGEGPLVLPELGPSARTLILQAFMATVITLLLPISALSQERLRTAAALRAREEQYRLLADHSSDLVLRLDGQGRALFVSSAARRLLGVTEVDLAGEALSQRIHPLDEARFRSVLVRSRENGEAVSCFRMRNERGDYRWIEAHCRTVGETFAMPPSPHQSCEAAREGRCLPGADAPCDGGRGPNRLLERAEGDVTFVASLRDIHQRRVAELLATESAVRLRESNRLLLMAEGLASLGHWVHEPQSGDILLSAEAAALLGVSQLTFAPADLLARIKTEDRRHLLRALVMASRYDAPAQCTLRIGEEGSERTIQLRVQQRESLDGTPGLFGVVSDITEKLRAEGRLVAALEEARRAAEFRSQFLATMSHEIRTPMTGVVGMIELLSDEPSPAQRRLYLDTLRRSADLLMAVLNDILDYSKVDSGRLTFDAEPFDLGALLRTTFRLFERPAETRGLRLTLQAPLPGECWLSGDALRLQQVVSNLLNNAIKFSERGEVALRCAVHPRARGRQALRITVADRGIGISADVQQRLFEPFVQGPGSASAGGTGLGLAISRRLVSGMGGTITLRSSEGRGSSFTVSLVLPAASGQAEQVRSAEVQPARPLDILLAEDNAINQLLITALLRRMGHRVTCAADGEAALLAAAGRPFDVILMDMQMPRRNGLSTAAAIRHGGGPNAATPILALTADAGVERRSCYQGGPIDQVLSKPVDSEALRLALAVWSSPPLPVSGAGKSDLRSPPLAAAADPVLDPAVLQEIRSVLGGARLDDLLDLFAAELETRPKAIREALADHAPERAAAEAHSLKGAAANLGAAAVARAAARLEDTISAVAAGSRSQSRIAPALRTLAEAGSEAQHALAAVPRFRGPLACGA